MDPLGPLTETLRKLNARLEAVEGKVGITAGAGAGAGAAPPAPYVAVTCRMLPCHPWLGTHLNTCMRVRLCVWHPRLQSGQEEVEEQEIGAAEARPSDHPYPCWHVEGRQLRTSAGSRLVLSCGRCADGGYPPVLASQSRSDPVKLSEGIENNHRVAIRNCEFMNVHITSKCTSVSVSNTGALPPPRCVQRTHM